MTAFWNRVWPLQLRSVGLFGIVSNPGGLWPFSFPAGDPHPRGEHAMQVMVPVFDLQALACPAPLPSSALLPLRSQRHTALASAKRCPALRSVHLHALSEAHLILWLDSYPPGPACCLGMADGCATVLILSVCTKMIVSLHSCRTRPIRTVTDCSRC